MERDGTAMQSQTFGSSTSAMNIAEQFVKVDVLVQKLRRNIKLASPLHVERSPDSYRERGEVL
jgi:hypothetical protein